MNTYAGYTNIDLERISKHMPIGYLQDRLNKAILIDRPYTDMQDIVMYHYDEATEKYFRDTYDKYVPSNMWDEHFEEVNETNSRNIKRRTSNASLTPRVPKIVSGCCDRADQY